MDFTNVKIPPPAPISAGFTASSDIMQRAMAESSASTLKRSHDQFQVDNKDDGNDSQASSSSPMPANWNIYSDMSKGKDVAMMDSIESPLHPFAYDPEDCTFPTSCSSEEDERNTYNWPQAPSKAFPVIDAGNKSESEEEEKLPRQRPNMYRRKRVKMHSDPSEPPKERLSTAERLRRFRAGESSTMEAIAETSPASDPFSLDVDDSVVADAGDPFSLDVDESTAQMPADDPFSLDVDDSAVQIPPPAPVVRKGKAKLTFEEKMQLPWSYDTIEVSSPDSVMVDMMAVDEGVAEESLMERMMSESPQPSTPSVPKCVVIPAAANKPATPPTFGIEDLDLLGDEHEFDMPSFAIPKSILRRANRLSSNQASSASNTTELDLLSAGPSEGVPLPRSFLTGSRLPSPRPSEDIPDPEHIMVSPAFYEHFLTSRPDIAGMFERKDELQEPDPVLGVSRARIQRKIKVRGSNHQRHRNP